MVVHGPRCVGQRCVRRTIYCVGRRDVQVVRNRVAACAVVIFRAFADKRPERPPADGAAASEPEEDSPAEVVEELQDDDGLALTERLQAYRDEWAWGEVRAQEHFYVITRSYLDVVRCYPCAHAKAWTEYVGGGRGGHSFALSAHGDDLAQMPARQWGSTLLHFHVHWLADPNEDPQVEDYPSYD